MSKQILILGHGYVGSAAARRLLEAGHSVVGVNRSAEEGAGYPVLEGNLAERDSLEELRERLDSPPEILVHSASSGRGGADAYRSVFLEGAAHLEAVFPGVPIFFTSSTSVYGQTDGSVVTEDSETRPERETSRILLEAEKRIRAAGGTVLRLAGIYGPGRSIYLQRILEGTASIESGPVSRLVNQIHRDDAASAIAHLIDLDPETPAGEIFNVVDDIPMTQRECYQRLAYLLDLPIPPEAPANRNRKRAWTHKAVSNGALKLTGWEPRFPSFFDAIENDPDLLPSIRDRISGERDGRS